MHLVLDSFYTILRNFPSKSEAYQHTLGQIKHFSQLLWNVHWTFFRPRGINRDCSGLPSETTSQHTGRDSVRDSWRQAMEDSNLQQAEPCKPPSRHRQEALGKLSGLGIPKKELSPINGGGWSSRAQRACKGRAAKEAPGGFQRSSRQHRTRGKPRLGARPSKGTRRATPNVHTGWGLAPVPTSPSPGFKESPQNEPAPATYGEQLITQKGQTSSTCFNYIPK